jgi:hypothetical protein
VLGAVAGHSLGGHDSIEKGQTPNSLRIALFAAVCWRAIESECHWQQIKLFCQIAHRLTPIWCMYLLPLVVFAAGAWQVEIDARRLPNRATEVARHLIFAGDCREFVILTT